MILNRSRLRSSAKAAATEYLRRHHRHGIGENLCTPALVNHFKAPVSLSYGSGHLLNNFRNSIQATVRFCTLTVSKDGVSQPHSKTPEGATVANKKPSALFNRLIRRREALVYNTPDDHVTRDIREGLAKLGDLRFKVLDSAGLETEASSGSILNRTSAMTANVLARTQFAIFLIDVRTGLHPLDQEVGRWLRKHAPGINLIVAMNKSESLHNDTNSFAEAATEALKLGFESKVPLQLAIVGRPNVGKSTLLNTLLEEDRVLVGPEAGLTRDSVRAQFQYQGRTVYLVDTAGWLQRGNRHKGPASLSIMQSRKNLMRAHVVALVLDAEEVVKAWRSLTHAEVVIARQAVEEGRGLVVIVNKMDLLKGKRNSALYKKIMEAVPQEIQMVIPQITGIPVVFISAIDGKGRAAVMSQVIDTYEKWCLRLSTARLNRWLLKVTSRHSWKDHGAKTKIKYFTQVKARPPTFVAFVNGNTKLSDTYRSVPRMAGGNSSKGSQCTGKTVERTPSDKRSVLV
ncbi:hypothetical protein F3Y22_tig00004041pilonHSYRG00054 [Hibiscus syriacus]|uniref:GTPase Der n=1 Tax=Hibiscus syriacus TaxID=106335 RepID=A0A6A3CJQ4_HIBSY|nr:hypothetical protein F3Y22_tig00004041pilonHSYRG00054 [Hibiscus syriacus]